ncbi:MAG: Glycine cleavage system H protein [Chlamydiae bacterium]|nr:Glycine cleavage system H protein [Chlamydiota bacterium]
MHYSQSHEWVKVTNSHATIGVSFFAQKELGEIVYIELPKLGAEVKSGDEIVVLESTKAAADVYAPISGIIDEVNLNLKDNPELINESPQSSGWLVKIRITHIEELEQLMTEEAYQDYIDGKSASKNE